MTTEKKYKTKKKKKTKTKDQPIWERQKMAG